MVVLKFISEIHVIVDTMLMLMNGLAQQYFPEQAYFPVTKGNNMNCFFHCCINPSQSDN